MKGQMSATTGKAGPNSVIPLVFFGKAANIRFSSLILQNLSFWTTLSNLRLEEQVSANLYNETLDLAATH